MPLVFWRSHRIFRVSRFNNALIRTTDEEITNLTTLKEGEKNTGLRKAIHNKNRAVIKNKKNNHILPDVKNHIQHCLIFSSKSKTLKANKTAYLLWNF